MLALDRGERRRGGAEAVRERGEVLLREVRSEEAAPRGARRRWSRGPAGRRRCRRSHPGTSPLLAEHRRRVAVVHLLAGLEEPRLLLHDDAEELLEDDGHVGVVAGVARVEPLRADDLADRLAHVGAALLQPLRDGLKPLVGGTEVVEEEEVEELVLVPERVVLERSRRASSRAPPSRASGPASRSAGSGGRPTRSTYIRRRRRSGDGGRPGRENRARTTRARPGWPAARLSDSHESDPDPRLYRCG